MPTHAILISYRDMEPTNLPEFIKRASEKYKGHFEQLYFDEGEDLKLSLYKAVAGISATDKLKIYISGHGGTGVQYITANDQVRKQTVDDLASLLKWGLAERAGLKEAYANTEVVMLSCLFGRTPNGVLDDNCPAVSLHRKLKTKEVYVDLVARTEISTSTSAGRQITTLLDYKMKKEYLRRKTRFSKIRCTYEKGASVVLIRDYDNKDDLFIKSDSTEGRRILWADNVINELVEYVKPVRSEGEPTDERRKILSDFVTWYDAKRDPVSLYGRLYRLIHPEKGDPEKYDFTRHRGVGFGLPTTARLIERLLKGYPQS